MERCQGPGIQDCLCFGKDGVELIPSNSVRFESLSQERLHGVDGGFPQSPEVRSPRRNVVPVDLVVNGELLDSLGGLL